MSENEKDAENPVKEIDNEWYTFVSNDKKVASETEMKVENNEIQGNFDKNAEKNKTLHCF